MRISEYLASLAHEAVYAATMVAALAARGLEAWWERSHE